MIAIPGNYINRSCGNTAEISSSTGCRPKEETLLDLIEGLHRESLELRDMLRKFVLYRPENLLPPAVKDDAPIKNPLDTIADSIKQIRGVNRESSDIISTVINRIGESGE